MSWCDKCGDWIFKECPCVKYEYKIDDHCEWQSCYCKSSEEVASEMSLKYWNEDPYGNPEDVSYDVKVKDKKGTITSYKTIGRIEISFRVEGKL